jgi:hypothetical protein
VRNSLAAQRGCQAGSCGWKRAKKLNKREKRGWEGGGGRSRSLGETPFITSGVKNAPTGVKVVASGVKEVSTGGKVAPNEGKVASSGGKDAPNGVKDASNGTKVVPTEVKNATSGGKVVPR